MNNASNKNLEYYLNLKYSRTIDIADDGSYFVSYPDLPGCMTCAPTLEEALKLGEDAKLSWLEIALEDGREILEPRHLDDFSGNFRIRMPKELHRTIALEAEREGISMNQYCIYLLAKNHGLSKGRSY